MSPPVASAASSSPSSDPPLEFPQEQSCGGGPCFENSACLPPAPTALTRKFPDPYRDCEHTLPNDKAPIKSPPATYFFSKAATDAARAKTPGVCCYKATHYAG